MNRPLSVYFPSATEEMERLLQSELQSGNEEHPVEVIYGKDAPAAPTYEVLITGRPSEEQLRASPELRVLLIPFAGLPKSTVEVLADFPDLAVHNLHHNAAPTSEMAMALLLSAAKEVIPLDRSLRAGDWSARYDSKAGVLLEGKTALIIGYGAIGRRVATVCAAFGMTVVAASRTGATACDPSPVELISIADVAPRWPQADFVMVCAPMTPATEGLIGEEQLAALPDDAVIVNIGRGPIIDERALYESLRDGTIGAAGLDVWYQYPEDKESRTSTQPSEYPFHELDNVVMSPHRGGHTEAMELLRTRYLAESLRQYAATRTMPWLVDVTRGY